MSACDQGDKFCRRDPAAGSEAIDRAAAQWAVRRRAGLDAQGERELAGWLAADPAHEEAFARLSAMSEVLQRARRQGATGDIVTQLKIRARKRRGRRNLATMAAAAVAIVMAGIWAQPRLAEPRPIATVVAAPAFEPVRRLPDGSLIELKPGTEIAVRYDAEVRRVELARGEALFRVEKDPTRPFIVRASGVEVRAVGTSFNVQLATAAVTVLVTEGRVRVDDVARGESLLPRPPAAVAVAELPLLVAGQKMHVEVAATGAVLSPPQIAEVTAAEIRAALAWRIPRLEFDGVEIMQAVAEMNRQNRLQIVIEDDAVRRLRVSGVFLADDPETFVRLIANTFGLTSERRGGDEVVLQLK